ncbi:breast cancer metastasis-suppressor 1-like protein [Cricetulus griseus]|nr:breast cancer metastasis-suppressor 1-like protein [Cricetulus griseus]
MLARPGFSSQYWLDSSQHPIISIPGDRHPLLDSSEMDDEDCERRRMECLDEMSNLEKQFTDLKDQLYKERLSQVDAKLQEVMAGKAPEYLEPLATLQENMQIRTKVAGIYRELCLESVKNKYECEIQASRQHCESEKLLLYDTVQSELEEKIRRLEEDRHSIDITSELWNDELQSRKKRKDPFSPDKKKPVVVSDILSHSCCASTQSVSVTSAHTDFTWTVPEQACEDLQND